MQPSTRYLVAHYLDTYEPSEALRLLSELFHKAPKDEQRYVMRGINKVLRAVKPMGGSYAGE